MRDRSRGYSRLAWAIFTNDTGCEEGVKAADGQDISGTVLKPVARQTRKK